MQYYCVVMTWYFFFHLIQHLCYYLNSTRQSGPDVSFASCGMPYFIGGEITDRNQVGTRFLRLHKIVAVILFNVQYFVDPFIR